MKHSFIFILYLLLSALPGQTSTTSDLDFPNAWNEIESLIEDGKYEAADRIALEILTGAREADDAEYWARALIEHMQLRTALGAAETAVRDLRTEHWPEDPRWRGVIELFYAQSLANYHRRYSYEIRSRETVAGADSLDLKTWNNEQFSREINAAFVRVWSTRDDWGRASLGDWSKLIDQNTYPARIRGTLRDAVSYLWIEHLADTGLIWLPHQASEVDRLDLEPLLTGIRLDDEAVALSDPEIHPLRKISHVLSDLRDWHLAGGRHEAALEAELEALRQMRRAIGGTQRRLRIRQYLETRLADFDPTHAWWSMGQLQRANFLKQENTPDNLVRAHLAADEGARRHPERIGGLLCEDVREGIEAPGFDLKTMTHDAPEKRSIQIRHKNLDTLYFRAWKYDLVGRLDDGRNSRLSGEEYEALIAGPEPDLSWTVALPPTEDYRLHETYTGMPACNAGAYAVVASQSRDFGQGYRRTQGLGLIVSDLVLSPQMLDDRVEFLARSAETGHPLPRVEIALYPDANRNRPGTGDVVRLTTDESGRAVHTVERHVNFGVLARRGADLAWMDRQSFYPRSERRAQTQSFIYTDRPVYQPGQTIHWKIVGYTGNPQRTEFHTLGDHDVKVRLLDANNQETAVANLQTNTFGSAAGTFEIPESGLLGNWRIEDSFGGTARVAVEQYKRPTFEVSLLDPVEPLQLRRRAVLTGQVDYFFGLPVTAGGVRWRVTRAAAFRRGGWDVPMRNTDVVASGETTLDPTGRFELDFMADPGSDPGTATDVVYRYLVEADVTGTGGETRSAHRTFALGPVSVRAAIEAEFGFLLAETPAEVTVRLTDLNQVPQAGAGRWSLYRLEQPDDVLLPAETPRIGLRDRDSICRTPGDDLNPRWQAFDGRLAVLAHWEAGPQLETGQLDHGADGAATIRLPGMAGGAYRIVYTTHDDDGGECVARRDFVVAERQRTPLNLALVLEPEYATVPVGGTARFLVHSGLPGQDLYVQVFVGGRRVQAEILRVDGRTRIVEIPVTAAAHLGLQVRVDAVRDHQQLMLTRSVAVPWDEMKLNVEFVTFRDRLVPGGRESFTVRVTGADAAAVNRATTELVAYMYDRSLDDLARGHPPRPLNRFGGPGWIMGHRASLGPDGVRWRSRVGHVTLEPLPTLRPDRLLWLRGFGIIQRNGRLYVRGGRSGEVSLGVPPPGGYDLGGEDIPVAETFLVEGAEYMVEVKSALTDHAIGGGTFDKYAIDTVENALGRQAGVVMRAGDLSERGGRAGDIDAFAGIRLREDFSESAFFLPHVQIDDDGQATIEFKVPDSVTDWSVWVHALTRDLQSGTARRQASSVKDLMVRPYLPRFLREGDAAELKIVVNNAGTSELDGQLELTILDPVTGRLLNEDFGLTDNLRPFRVAANTGCDLAFSLRAPTRVGSVLVKAVARAGRLSDGEQRALPVLPGRMHLAQSRFVALGDTSRGELRFPMLAADDDATRIHDRLVVTIDAQLFTNVLGALPYLVDYPYECTEQTLNRYLSTSILAGVFAEHPRVRALAEQLSTRQTRTEAWSVTDPNRRLLLEETPWLRTSAGDGTDEALINILDPANVDRQRQTARDKLHELQTARGGFPWFPGGRPSPHLTLYILLGLARGAEFGVETPDALVKRAWRYLHDYFRSEGRNAADGRIAHLPTSTLLIYVLSSYPPEVWQGAGFTEQDRLDMLEASYRHWRDMSPLLKGYLALALQRTGRQDDAHRVYESVMDAAKTGEDLGTYWAPEDRSWLWYNDTVESHAFTLRVMAELAPEDPRRAGLVQWLLLNKKLSHWKSTRATAEAIYALVHFMRREGTLAVREAIDVKVGPRTRTFVFDPKKSAETTNQLVIEGDAIDPARMATVVVSKETPGLAFATATWHFSTEEMPSQADGDLFAVTRQYFRRFHDGREWILQPLAAGDPVAVGDQIEVQLSVSVGHAAEYVHLRDPRGAGFEPESTQSGYRRRAGLGYYEEVRDSGANFFFDRLPVGQYTLKYQLRTTMAGEFKVGPATLRSMYAPEFTAYSAGRTVRVTP